MKQKLNSLDIQANTVNANTVKGMIIERLLRDQVITKEQAEKYSNEFQIIMVKRSWFEKWFSLFAQEEEEGYYYKLVKFEKDL